MTNRTYHPRGERVHGFRVQEHPLYVTWADMLSRCYNEANPSYPNYGGRGIRVSPRWHHFRHFAEDMGLPASPELSLDRRNNDAGYSKSNCRWATSTEQNWNRRTFKNNTSGRRGVVETTVREVRFLARFDYRKVRYDIGRFDTAEAAHLAREAFVGLFFVDRDAALQMLEEPTVWCNSSTQVRGVTPHADGGFIARTTINGRREYLGYFKTVEAAAAAIQQRKVKP